MAFLSLGNFGVRVVPNSEESNLQQFIVVGMWLAIAAVSYFRRVTLKIDPSVELYICLAPYALAVVSILWSDNPGASVTKALALVVVNFGAYRLIKTTAWDDIVEYAIHGLFLLNAVSVFLCLFVPDIGLLKNWQHYGQWNGIFDSKQTLGFAGAMLSFLSSYRLIEPPRRFYHFVAAAAALACVIGSGSRGGGALAAVAVACVYLAGVSTSFTRVLAFAPFVMGLLGCLLILYFVETGNKYLSIFGPDLDFTERTFIWQHALSYFKDAPIFGFGLNGFWTLKDVKDTFLEKHGWFLDNYHDGYIGVVMETGAFGLALFIAGYLLFGRKISADMRRHSLLHKDARLALVFTCLMFFIDFTEWFFLRSTNLSSTMLFMSIFVCFARRPFAAPAVSPPPRAPKAATAGAARKFALAAKSGTARRRGLFRRSS